MKCRLSLLCIALFLSSCVMKPEYYDEQLKQLIHIDDLLLNWGEPNKIIKMSNENLIYEYNYSPLAGLGNRYEVVPTNTFTSKQSESKGSSERKSHNTERRTTYKPVFVTQDCVTRFVIHKENGLILKHSFTGRDCVARKIKEEK